MNIRRPRPGLSGSAGWDWLTCRLPSAAWSGRWRAGTAGRAGRRRRRPQRSPPTRSTRCGSACWCSTPPTSPVLVNPAAVELGLVRAGVAAPQQVHAVIRTLAGQVRRSGVRREVELDLPRGRRRRLRPASRSACGYG